MGRYTTSIGRGIGFKDIPWRMRLRSRPSTLKGRRRRPDSGLKGDALNKPRICRIACAVRMAHWRCQRIHRPNMDPTPSGWERARQAMGNRKGRTHASKSAGRDATQGPRLGLRRPSRCASQAGRAHLIPALRAARSRRTSAAGINEMRSASRRTNNDEEHKRHPKAAASPRHAKGLSQRCCVESAFNMAPNKAA